MVERLAVLDRPANMLVDRAQVQRVLLREVRRVFVHARAWPKDCRTVARLEAKKQQGVVLMPNSEMRINEGRAWKGKAVGK